MSDSGDYESEHFERDNDHGRGSGRSSRSGSRSSSASRSRSVSPPRRQVRPHSAAASRPRGSRPSDVAPSSRRAREREDAEANLRDGGAYYEDTDLLVHGGDAEVDRANSDLRSATAALSATHLAKLRPADVAGLKGLSGDAWARKLGELVSTVKGESYSRAPASASLLIDSTGAAALGGRAINHHDPSSFGSSSGSHLSANPPPYVSAAKRAQAASVASNQRLFNIARTADGAVYGSKAYGAAKGGVRVEQKDKVLDKFSMDAEDMHHTISQLRKQAASLKVDLHTFHREVDLLDAHLQAQNAALDAAALKKGFLRVGAPDKPRYEKAVSGAQANALTQKMSLEEQHLTLQVQHKSLRAQKARLERQYDQLQDELGTLTPQHLASQESDRETRARLVSELHQLQTSMHTAKAEHESEAHIADQRIAELRHEAGTVQAQLEVQRTTLTATTLACQQAQDQRQAMQAKINAIKKRIAKHQSH